MAAIIMRGMRRWLGAALQVLWVVVALASAAPSAAEPVRLNEAQATVTIKGITQSGPMRLPYHWDRINPGQRGEATFNFQFDLPSAPTEVWGIYLPRLGNAYEIWLNGSKLQYQGSMAQSGGGDAVYNGADYARVPRYITVGDGHFGVHNHLRIRIRADVGRRGGLAPPVIGPQEQVYPLYEHAYRWRVTGSIAVVALCFVFGLTALALWGITKGLPQTDRSGRDALYLYAAVAQFFWALYVADVLVENPPLPWPWWGVLQVLALGIWSVCMALTCMETAGWRNGWAAYRFRQWLILLMLLCPVMAWTALVVGVPMALTAWYGLAALTLLLFVVVFLRSAALQPSLERQVVGAAALVNIAVGLRDFFVFRLDPSFGANTWSRYSSLLFGLAFGFVVLTRFRATNEQLRDLLATLAARVSEKEETLRTAYTKMETMARHQERLAERGRILRNMHDGVGAHITSAMRQLLSGGGRDTPARTQVLMTLRDALDNLKLSIDSIHLAPGDITALLANLRYRLGPRFSAMGIELQWDVDLLPICEKLDASAMGELQFMLFEALSNVLQHAQAHTLRVEAHIRAHGESLDDASQKSEADQIYVRVVDDGVGFDPQARQSKGLANLRKRAVAIGAQLRISSTPGNTVVEIQLDV